MFDYPLTHDFRKKKHFAQKRQCLLESRFNSLSLPSTEVPKRWVIRNLSTTHRWKQYMKEKSFFPFTFAPTTIFCCNSLAIKRLILVSELSDYKPTAKLFTRFIFQRSDSERNNVECDCLAISVCC